MHHTHLHSQQVHILHHTLHFFLGLLASHHPPTLTPSDLLTCPNHLSLLCLTLSERSSTPHISATSLLDFPSCHLTPAMYLSIQRSHLRRTSTNLHVSAHQVSEGYTNVIQFLAMLSLFSKWNFQTEIRNNAFPDVISSNFPIFFLFSYMLCRSAGQNRKFKMWNRISRK